MWDDSLQQQHVRKNLLSSTNIFFFFKYHTNVQKFFMYDLSRIPFFPFQTIQLNTQTKDKTIYSFKGGHLSHNSRYRLVIKLETPLPSQ